MVPHGDPVESKISTVMSENRHHPAQMGVRGDGKKPHSYPNVASTMDATDQGSDTDAYGHLSGYLHGAFWVA